MVRHLLRLYKRSAKPSLYLALEGVKVLVARMGWRLAYRYVPRELNAQADDMCLRARAREANVVFREGQVPADAPPLDLQALYAEVASLASANRVAYLSVGVYAAHGGQVEATVVGSTCEGRTCADRIAAVWDERLRGVACRRCGGLEVEELMVVCDRCDSPFHAACEQHVSPVVRGPWYCGACRGWLLTNGHSDPIEDLALLDYLFRGRVPDHEEEHARVQRMSGTYRADGEELLTCVRPYGHEVLARWVPIPPVCMRRQIIRDTHEALGHCGRDKVAEAILSSWWWRDLRREVGVELAQCHVCQPERVGPERWGPLLEVDQVTRPFMGWSVDLMVGLPADDRGCCVLAVAVDVFSKWVEATPLTDKRAFTTCEWLYDAIVARWGRPIFIRSDNGKEWEAEFRKAMRRLGITVRRATVGNSRANGQSEVIIRVFRIAIRKYLAAHPTLFWSDVVPFVLMALRMAPTRAHGFPPFTLVTGQIPILPSDLHVAPVADLPQDPTPGQEEAYIEQVCTRVE